jgi:hypothetical protein
LYHCPADEAIPDSKPASTAGIEPQVSFLQLDISDEESIGEVLAHIDMATQFGEDAEVKIREYDAPEDGE